MKTIFIFLLAILSIFSISCKKEVDEIILSGEWYQEINFDNDTSFQYIGFLYLSQDPNNNLVGHFIYEGNVRIYVDVNEAYVDGNKIHLSWKLYGNEIQPPPDPSMNPTFVFEGTFDANNMSGIWYSNDVYQGTWNAIRENNYTKNF
jgi:hypothetical protein